jgi:hypothetical protein
MKQVSFFVPWFQMAANSKWFQLEGWGWAHFLHLFKLFPGITNSFIFGGGRRGSCWDGHPRCMCRPFSIIYRRPTSGRCIPVCANACASETSLQPYNWAVGTQGSSEYQFKVLARPGLEPKIFQLDLSTYHKLCAYIWSGKMSKILKRTITDAPSVSVLGTFRVRLVRYL